MTEINNLKQSINKPSIQVQSNSSSGSDTASVASNSNNGTNKFTLTTADGVTHSVIIQEDGTVWNYNETANSWSEKVDNQIVNFSSSDAPIDIAIGETIDLSNVNVNSETIKEDSTIFNYKLASGSTLTNHQSMVSNTQKDTDNNSNQYNVAVIDDFDTSIFDDGTDTPQVDISHGELVRALISPNNPYAASSTANLNYNVGNGLSLTSILNALKDIEGRINRGEDIDAVNLSLGMAEKLQDLIPNVTSENLKYMLANLTNNDNEYNAIKNSLPSDLVSIINQIEEMAKNGIEFFISAGNDADDSQYQYNTDNIWAYTKDCNGNSVTINNKGTIYTKESVGEKTYNYLIETYADIDGDGVLTDYDLLIDSEKFLGISADMDGDNVITDADGYLANQKYDTNSDGTINGRELGIFNALTLARGSNVHVIGATSSAGNDSSFINGTADYSDINGTVDACYDGDVEIDYIGTTTVNGKTKYMWDVDSDGNADIISDTNPDNLTSNQAYTENGTSFAAPRAAKANKKDNPYLA